MLTLIELVSTLCGVVLASLLFAYPRFGRSSWLLAVSVVLAFSSTGILGLAPAAGWHVNDSIFFSFVCLLLCAGSGCLATYTLTRPNYIEHLRKNRWFFFVISGAAPILITALLLVAPSHQSPGNLEQVELGPVGYVAGIYLLIVSLIALANVEEILRSAEKHVRREIQFLLLGLAFIFAALIYVAFHILLYPPNQSLLPRQSIHVFPIMFLCSCLLVYQSWRRTGARRTRDKARAMVAG